MSAVTSGSTEYFAVGELKDKLIKMLQNDLFKNSNIRHCNEPECGDCGYNYVG